MGFSSEQFVEKVDENLKCAICLDVLEDPWQCRDGHTFCKACITRWLTNKQICPVGKNALQLNSLGRCLPMKNMIENLKVYCDPSQGKDAKEEHFQSLRNPSARKRSICDWTGKLHSLAKHRETCPFQQVQCPNVNCNTNMQRRELEDHDKICDHKKVKCHKCGVVMIRLVLQVHKDADCPEEMVPCPNSCTCPPAGKIMKTIKRLNLDDHLRNKCTKAILDCPFKDQGCSVQVERQHVDKHVQENMAAHMTLLAKQYSTLTKKCESLTEQVILLTKENKQLKEEFIQVKKNDELSRTYRWEIKNCLKLDLRSSTRSPSFRSCGFSWYLEIIPYVDELVSVHLFLDESNREDLVHCKSISVQCRLIVRSHRSNTEDLSLEKIHVFRLSPGFRHWSKTTTEIGVIYFNAIPAYCDNNGDLNINCSIQVLDIEK